uniref:PPM-type phosphatase domain-containing protein n=1 Tax=Chenopodium quinoa TaxID=63459 RepID=A0A803LVK0_CHEQI
MLLFKQYAQLKKEIKDYQKEEKKDRFNVGQGSTESSAETGKGKSKISKNVTHGYHTAKGKSAHPMEDYVFAELSRWKIMSSPDFWTETENAVRKAYRITDSKILEKSADLGKGGSTAVTAILINCQKLVVANLGDSRAVISRNGKAKQLSVDHEPDSKRKDIEDRGGFVTKFPGDVARVDGQLAVARAFGDKTMKEHLSSEPHITIEMIDEDTDFILLASDGIWHVSPQVLILVHIILFSPYKTRPSFLLLYFRDGNTMVRFIIFWIDTNVSNDLYVMNNQEAVDCIKNVKDAREAAKALIEEALHRNSTDDISVSIVDSEGLQEIRRLAGHGKLNVPVEKTFPIVQVREAHEAKEKRIVPGKVVLEFD